MRRVDFSFNGGIFRGSVGVVVDVVVIGVSISVIRESLLLLLRRRRRLRVETAVLLITRQSPRSDGSVCVGVSTSNATSVSGRAAKVCRKCVTATAVHNTSTAVNTAVRTAVMMTAVQSGGGWRNNGSGKALCVFVIMIERGGGGGGGGVERRSGGNLRRKRFSSKMDFGGIFRRSTAKSPLTMLWKNAISDYAVSNNASATTTNANAVGKAYANTATDRRGHQRRLMCREHNIGTGKGV